MDMATQTRVERGVSVERRNVRRGWFFCRARMGALSGRHLGRDGLVTQRTHEIGLLVALGAQQRDILQLAISRGSRLAFACVAVGWLLALVLTRPLAKELLGVTATDPVTFSCCLRSVAFAACYIPADRAMRLEPLAALRYE